MPTDDKLFAGSIPELYDRYLVPLIFEPYAADLADRTAALKPGHVLETAAGTGVLTSALAARLPATARMTVTDLNQPMLDRAASRQSRDARITWQQADALALPFADGMFDVVCCQFGAMFFPDKVKGYAEARRVLKRGGCFLFNVWDGIADNEFADVVTKAVAGLFPQDPPQFLARTPHGHGDVNVIRGHLVAAGFAGVSVATLDAVSRAAQPLDVAIAYCQGTPLRNEIEARSPSALAAATEAASAALAQRFDSGPIEGRIRAHVLTASA